MILLGASSTASLPCYTWGGNTVIVQTQVVRDAPRKFAATSQHDSVGAEFLCTCHDLAEKAVYIIDGSFT